MELPCCRRPIRRMECCVSLRRPLFLLNLNVLSGSENTAAT